MTASVVSTQAIGTRQTASRGIDERKVCRRMCFSLSGWREENAKACSTRPYVKQRRIGGMPLRGLEPGSLATMTKVGKGRIESDWNRIRSDPSQIASGPHQIL